MKAVEQFVAKIDQINQQPVLQKHNAELLLKSIDPKDLLDALRKTVSPTSSAQAFRLLVDSASRNLQTQDTLVALLSAVPFCPRSCFSFLEREIFNFSLRLSLASVLFSLPVGKSKKKTPNDISAGSQSVHQNPLLFLAHSRPESMASILQQFSCWMSNELSRANSDLEKVAETNTRLFLPVIRSLLSNPFQRIGSRSTIQSFVKSVSYLLSEISLSFLQKQFVVFCDSAAVDHPFFLRLRILLDTIRDLPHSLMSQSQRYPLFSSEINIDYFLEISSDLLSLLASLSLLNKTLSGSVHPIQGHLSEVYGRFRSVILVFLLSLSSELASQSSLTQTLFLIKRFIDVAPEIQLSPVLSHFFTALLIHSLDMDDAVLEMILELIIGQLGFLLDEKNIPLAESALRVFSSLVLPFVRFHSLSIAALPSPSLRKLANQVLQSIDQIQRSHPQQSDHVECSLLMIDLEITDGFPQTALLVLQKLLHSLSCAMFACLSTNDPAGLIEWIQNISSCSRYNSFNFLFSEKLFVGHYFVLPLLFHEPLVRQREDLQRALVAAVNDFVCQQPLQCLTFFPPLVDCLRTNQQLNPEIKIDLMVSICSICRSEYCVGPVLRFLQESEPLDAVLSLRLLLSLWKIQDRLFPKLEERLNNLYTLRVQPLIRKLQSQPKKVHPTSQGSLNDELLVAFSLTIFEISQAKPSRALNFLPYITELLGISEEVDIEQIEIPAIDQEPLKLISSIYLRQADELVIGYNLKSLAELSNSGFIEPRSILQLIEPSLVTDCARPFVLTGLCELYGIAFVVYSESLVEETEKASMDNRRSVEVQREEKKRPKRSKGRSVATSIESDKGLETKETERKEGDDEEEDDDDDESFVKSVLQKVWSLAKHKSALVREAAFSTLLSSLESNNDIFVRLMAVNFSDSWVQDLLALNDQSENQNAMMFLSAITNNDLIQRRKRLQIDQSLNPKSSLLKAKEKLSRSLIELFRGNAIAEFRSSIAGGSLFVEPSLLIGALHSKKPTDQATLKELFDHLLSLLKSVSLQPGNEDLLRPVYFQGWFVQARLFVSSLKTDQNETAIEMLIKDILLPLLVSADATPSSRENVAIFLLALNFQLGKDTLGRLVDLYSKTVDQPSDRFSIRCWKTSVLVTALILAEAKFKEENGLILMNQLFESAEKEVRNDSSAAFLSIGWIGVALQLMDKKASCPTILPTAHGECQTLQLVDRLIQMVDDLNNQQNSQTTDAHMLGVSRSLSSLYQSLGRIGGLGTSVEVGQRCLDFFLGQLKTQSSSFCSSLWSTQHIVAIVANLAGVVLNLARKDKLSHLHFSQVIEFLQVIVGLQSRNPAVEFDQCEKPLVDNEIVTSLLHGEWKEGKEMLFLSALLSLCNLVCGLSHAGLYVSVSQEDDIKLEALIRLLQSLLSTGAEAFFSGSSMGSIQNRVDIGRLQAFSVLATANLLGADSQFLLKIPSMGSPFSSSFSPTAFSGIRYLLSSQHIYEKADLLEDLIVSIVPIIRQGEGGDQLLDRKTVHTASWIAGSLTREFLPRSNDKANSTMQLKKLPLESPIRTVLVHLFALVQAIGEDMSRPKSSQLNHSTLQKMEQVARMLLIISECDRRKIPAINWTAMVCKVWMIERYLARCCASFSSSGRSRKSKGEELSPPQAISNIFREQEERQNSVCELLGSAAMALAIKLSDCIIEDGNEHSNFNLSEITEDFADLDFLRGSSKPIQLGFIHLLPLILKQVDVSLAFRMLETVAVVLTENEIEKVTFAICQSLSRLVNHSSQYPKQLNSFIDEMLQKIYAGFPSPVQWSSSVLLPDSFVLDNKVCQKLDGFCQAISAFPQDKLLDFVDLKKSEEREELLKRLYISCRLIESRKLDFHTLEKLLFWLVVEGGPLSKDIILHQKIRPMIYLLGRACLAEMEGNGQLLTKLSELIQISTSSPAEQIGKWLFTVVAMEFASTSLQNQIEASRVCLFPFVPSLSKTGHRWQSQEMWAIHHQLISREIMERRENLLKAPLLRLKILLNIKMDLSRLASD